MGGPEYARGYPRAHGHIDTPSCDDDADVMLIMMLSYERDKLKYDMMIYESYCS